MMTHYLDNETETRRSSRVDIESTRPNARSAAGGGVVRGHEYQISRCILTSSRIRNELIQLESVETRPPDPSVSGVRRPSARGRVSSDIGQRISRSITFSRVCLPETIK
ncbi:hypothetical protein EVAR_17685_1 [Eumeta japonica]|uniref:Uncharacterized protein n=1 Tax=Eumeta variegata TaxID=151549 RepID=A0A4C1USZ0_EUMVA|nr:hypothetical protein EVAR_17685_1 [Eumeta japonica]